MIIKIKCISAKERFFTQGKEYVISENNGIFYIRNDDNQIIEAQINLYLLLENLNDYWRSEFKFITFKEGKQ